MNKINEVRQETLKTISLASEEHITYDIIESPNKKYSAYITEYSISTQNLSRDALIARIRENKNEEEIATLVVNESTFFHSWVSKDGTDYLLCAEDLCGGETVVDLNNKKVYSYSENEDGFIWTKHILSPSKNKLAVFGCGWGSQFFIKVYSFEKPSELPLKVISETDWYGYDMLYWVDESKIKVLNNDKTEMIIDC